MDRFLRLNLSFLCCRTPRTLLALFWVAGLLLGAILSLSADTLLLPTMHTALFGSMSISGLLTSLLLPLFFTAFAVYISQPMLLPLIAFLKAFFFSFTAVGFLMTFGASAWLIRNLLMFSETLTLPLLWWLWMYLLSENCVVWYSTIPVGLAIVLIGCVDYTFIGPFLAALL